MYQMEIKENTLYIRGLFGKYEAKISEHGFDVSVIRDECASELDENGEEYLIDAGQEWSTSVDSLLDLDSFMKRCEEERLWNYMPGPVFRMKADLENKTLYLRGVTKSFLIGTDNKGLYIDDPQLTKTHKYIKAFPEVTKILTKEDKWWLRQASETMEIIRSSKSYASVTDGGRLQLVYKDKSYRIGQKDDGSFWVNVSADQERHIYFKDNWKDVLALLQ